MIRLAEDAVKARLNAAIAFREVSEGQRYTATDIRMAYNMDVFKPVPLDLADMAERLDRDAA